MKIAVAVVAVLALALGTAGTVYGVLEAGRVSAQAQQILREEAAIRSMDRQVRMLGNQVATLNVPSDPLSAYNEVCYQPLYNNNIGSDQTYYFPCTNQAQTTPQPGN